MKKLTKTLSLLLVAAMLLCGLSLPASAAVVKDLKVAYSGINIVLDGEIITPMNANGKIVQPFILGGTTYLPIRAVANSLNLGVDWDQATKTVTLDSSNPGPKPDPDASGILYADFKAFGGTVCTLYFPSNWGNTITADNKSSQGIISFYDKNNKAYGGRLFTLRLFSDNSYKELPKKKLLYDIIYQGRTYHLVKILPTDVQFGPGQQASYSAKSKEIDNIIDNLVFSSASRPASTISKTIKASYPGVKIILDGKTVTPKDVNGKVVDPFIVGGTTYLPIRAIASALGLGVDWDQATKTVTLRSEGAQEPTPASEELTLKLRAAIDHALAESDMDMAWQGYRALLNLYVSEFCFKSMGYGHFTDDYETELFTSCLDKAKELQNEMQEYFEKDEISSLYSLLAVDALDIFDDNMCNYDAYSIYFPNMDAMWNKYVEDKYLKDSN